MPSVGELYVPGELRALRESPADMCREKALDFAQYKYGTGAWTESTSELACNTVDYGVTDLVTGYRTLKQTSLMQYQCRGERAFFSFR